MKKKVFSLMMTLLLAASGFVRADELTVHDGTATNVYVPVYGFYADAYLKAEFVMPAAELAAMNGGTIESMTFYASQNNTDWGVANFQVFLTEIGTTTIEAFNGPGTVVYQGALGISSGQMVVSFTTPYTYNGGNLLIGVYNTAKGDYDTSTWYGETVNGASLQGYSYTSLGSVSGSQRNFLPKTTFTYTGGGSTPGGGGGGSSDPEIGLHVRYDNGEEGRELVIDDLYLGEYPAGAWMEPFHFEMYNDDTQALTVSVLDFTPNTDALSMATGTELPFTVAGNSAEYIDLAIQVQAPADTEAGDYEYQFVAIYEGSRLAKIWPLSFTIYTPEIPDVVEKAYDLGTIADGYTYTGVPSEITPTVLHNDYTLPFPEIPEGNDAVYKFTVEGDMIISAYVDETNADGKVALYTEDFNGEAGPMAHNNYTGLTRANGRNEVTVHDGDVTNGYIPTYGFYHDNYCKSEFVYPAADLSEMTGCDISSMKFYVASPGGSLNGWNSTQRVFVKEIADASISAFQGETGATVVFEGNLMAPTAAGDELEITFNTPYHYNGGNLLVGVYNITKGTWQNATYYGENVAGASISGYNSTSLDVINPSQRDFLPKTTFNYTAGGGGAAANAGPVIEALAIQAGTYYLVASSTDADYTVYINVDDMPCPAIDAPGYAFAPYPADDQDSIQPASVTLRWVNPEYATGWRLVFGSTYYPEAGHPQTVIYPEDGSFSTDMATSYTVTNLWNNTNYFWHVEFNNGACEDGVSSPIWGFTTTLNAPRNLVATPEQIFEGETTTLTWNAIVDRTYRSYRVYQDGVLIHTTTPNTNPEANLSYTVEGLTYNMTGYTFNVTAVYDEGESPYSNDAVVKVSGYSAEPGIYGYVYEQDSVTPIGGVTVTVTGTDEFGNAVNYSATTNADGYYTMHPVLAGEYATALAYCAGYQDAEPYTNVPPFTLPYQGTWGEMNFIMHEEFYPSPMVCAEVVQVGDDELVKVWWQIPDGTGGTGTGDFMSEYEAQVGNGTQETGYVPFYTLYDNSVSMSLYTAAELNAAGATPAPMTSISWQAGNQTGYAQQGITIWMANVTDTQVPTTTPNTANMTKVYTGSMTPVTGWNEFAFNAGEFAWDGTSNLLILVQRNNGTWNSTVYWKGQAAPNMVSYKYQDNTAFDVENTPVTGMSTTNVRPNIIFKGGTRADRADRAMHHYRIYRTDCYYDGPYYEGDPGGTIVLASAWVPDTAYFDVSWPDAAPGVYKWGVGVVYEGNQADNPNNPRNESEIRWAENTLTSIAPTPVSYTEGIRDFVPRDGNATVILTAGDVWGDGSGYQMLLDADATAYGNELPETGALSLNCSGNEAIYNVFEYRIPANADGNCSTSNIVMNSSISLTIPAGTYDWCITNPTPGDRIWIASENGTIGGRADDFVFEANKVYEFLVYAGGINDAVDLFVTDGTPVGPTPTPGNTCDNMLALPRESCTVWSNECSGCIDKNMDIPSLDGEQFVSINVVLNSADSPEGTIVSFTNLHEGEQAAHPQENLTLDESGHHDFETFRRGTYAIQIYHEGFYTILDTVGIGVEPDMAYELRYVMEEILYPARDFYVSYTGFAMWDIESGWEGGDVPTGDGGGTGANSFTEGFEGSLNGWNTIKVNAAGGEWLYSDNNPGGYAYAEHAHGGTGFAMCYSFVDYDGAYDTDAILYTPQKYDIVNGSTLTFWADNANDMYPESFSVVVATVDNPTAADFTQVWSGNAKGSMGQKANVRHSNNRIDNWRLHTVDLSNYAGQSIWIGFRDTNYDAYEVFIDDVELSTGRGTRHFEYYKVMCTSIDGQPIFNVDVTTPYCQLATDQLVENETYICKVAAVFSTGMSEWRETQWVYRSCENYAGTLNGVTINGSTISWDYPGGGPVPPVPPVPPTGEGLTEGFENGLGDWTNIDADGDGNVWMTGRDEAHTGTGYAESESYINYVGALTPDNYLVSPQVTLGGTFTFWASAQDPSYPAEKFGVAVSTAGNTNAADFTTLQTWTMTSKSPASTKAAVRGGTRAGTWYQYSVDLSAYAGQTGYVAIRHYDCTDQFILNVDDIELNAGSKGRANRDMTEGFESGLGDWTNIDADGDGNVWMTGRDEAHTGTGYAESESYINYVGALTPDNYLVSPQVTLGGTFTFWASAQDPSYPAEKFGVAVSTAGNTNAADFTTLQTWTMTSKSPASTKAAVRGGTRAGTWYQYSVDLSAYAGQTGYVAIRHYDCTDQFILNVDDIELVNGGVTPTPTPTPAEGIIGAAIYQNGQPVAFVDYPTNTWTMPESGEYCVRIIYDGPMDGSYYSMSCEECEGGEVTCEANFTINGEYFWNSDDDFGARLWWGEGGVNPDPDPVVGDGDTFTVNFDDSQIPAGWTIIDNGNPAGYGWQLASEKIGTGNGHNGSTDCILSQSYDNNTGVVYPDNWFISPAVTLANGSTFSLWACGQDAGYAAEHFGVFVSTTGTNPSDFTMVNEWTIGAKSDRYDGPRGNRDQSTWTQYVVDLSAYAGTGRYIAIRHFSCSDMFYLDVDDLELSNGRNRDGVVLYNIYRSTDNVNYELIDTLEAEAGVTEYEYIDNTAEAGVTYYYQVTAVYDNDCESTPALVEGSTNDYVVIGVTSIGENTGKVALYPNPTSGNVKIEANGMRHITVVSSLGQVVYDADVNADEMDLNMGQFTTGVYVVRIVTETGINTQRVTVVR